MANIDKASPESSKAIPPWINAFFSEFVVLCIVGALVALIGPIFLQHELIRSFDRLVTDAIMRSRGAVPNARPKLIFADIDDDTCWRWAKSENGDCGPDFLVPRDKIATLIDEIQNAPKRPLLVIVDIEASPRPFLPDADGKLCTALVSLARSVPIIVPRPLAEMPEDDKLVLVGLPSIYDSTGDKSNTICSVEALSHGLPNIWFASSAVQHDVDGVFRAVPAWEDVEDRNTAVRMPTAGIGLLAAALIQSDLPFNQAACVFPGSMSPREPCSGAGIYVGGSRYIAGPALQSAQRVQRIIFSLPYEPTLPETARRRPVRLADFERVSAEDLPHRLGVQSDFISGAIVIIGGSYSSSGDLEATPLQSRMPGAMVHANAIRAFLTSQLITEQQGEDWGVELGLLLYAASAGAFFKVIGASMSRSLVGRIDTIRRPIGPPRAAPLLKTGTDILVSLVAFVAIVGGVIAITVFLAVEHLAESGTSIAVVTPAIVIGIEGFSGALHNVKTFIEHSFTAVKEWCGRTSEGR